MKSFSRAPVRPHPDLALAWLIDAAAVSLLAEPIILAVALDAHRDGNSRFGGLYKTTRSQPLRPYRRGRPGAQKSRPRLTFGAVR